MIEQEKIDLEITDFGLGQLEQEGLILVVYVNNEHYCAKDLVLSQNQICLEHKQLLSKGTGKNRNISVSARYSVVVFGR